MAIRLGWFSTGRDQAAIDLWQVINAAIADRTIDAEMVFCFSNRVAGESIASDAFLAAVLATDTPLVTLSSDAFQPAARAHGRTDPDARRDWRLAYDRAVMDSLRDYQVDLIVLAGYMLIVGPEMCVRHTMINLHPALPGGPTGTWQQVNREVIASGVERTGAMMHLVTPALDRGPALSYFSFPVSGDFDAIRAAGAARELPLILLTIKEFADGRLKVEGGRVFAAGRELTAGYDLTDKVEAWLDR